MNNSRKTWEASTLTAIFENAADTTGEMNTAYCIYIYNLMRKCLLALREAGLYED